MHKTAVTISGFAHSGRSRIAVAFAVTVASALLLAGCSHKHTDKTASSAPAQAAGASDTGTFMTGGPSKTDSGQGKFVTQNTDTPAPMQAGKFVAPTVTGKGAPSLATVPNKAPTPPSTKQDKDKMTEGLVADLARARYTDSGGRTMPVAVRPLTEAQAQITEEPAAPPKPQAAQVGAVTRLGDQPPPGSQASTSNQAASTAAAPSSAPEPSQSAKASVEAAAQLAATAPAPRLPEMEGPRPSALPVARTDGFHPLGAYAPTTSQSNQVASIDFSGTGTSMTAVGRRALADAAQLGQRTTGAFRVIGRTTDPSNMVQDRATAVARELQRLGVAQDRIYVGTDTGPDGRVDVILDQ